MSHRHVITYKAKKRSALINTSECRMVRTPDRERENIEKQRDKPASFVEKEKKFRVLYERER